MRSEERIGDINVIMTVGLLLAFISPLAPWATYEVPADAPEGTAFDDGNAYLSVNVFSGFSHSALAGGLIALFLAGTVALLLTRWGLIAQWTGLVGFFLAYRDIVDVPFAYVQRISAGFVLAVVAAVVCSVAAIPTVERRSAKDNTRTDGKLHPDLDWMAHRGEVLHERKR